MVGSRLDREESIGSQRQDHFLNLEQMRDREVNMHTTHTSGTQSRSGSHVSHEKDTKAMQREIDGLRRRLCCERWIRTPSNFDDSFDGDRDGSYKPRSRTPPNESFLCDEDYHHECRNRSLSSKGLGNDVMSRALNQISRSPFMLRIQGGRLS